MERLVQALLALALVVPALAAPGPMFTALSQKPLDLNLNMNNTTGSPSDMLGTRSINVNPPVPADATSPLELRKKKKEKPKPSDNNCTPGDRYCHASLEEVLFCNDYQQWVQYARCQAGTFCHRLHLVCVNEVFPSPPTTMDTTTIATTGTAATTIASRTAGEPNRCKEGDRRCGATFNRVERCNSSHDWVTYHDCRKSELCDGGILECLPRVKADSVPPAPIGPAALM
ncbi:hypothetical protein F5Y10DRAFT_288698 [Nemania abortiva]|nr:hypothetical protein F5Y10DRAFT_288698 [Nemania abortiva]